MHQKWWQKLKLIWIDYEQLNWLWIILIVYLYPRTIQPSLFDANTNILTVFMISLLQHLLQDAMGEGSFFCLGKLLFYREVICFLINNLFGNVFQTSRVIGLIPLLSNCMWNSDAKEVFKLLEKVFSSLSVHFRVISMF